jgi:hypothetical protein
MIISNTAFKNKELALKYETTDTRLIGEAYLRAEMKTDSFNSYTYDDMEIYKSLMDFGYPEDRIYNCIKNHNLIPAKVKLNLLAEKRKTTVNDYTDPNKYYCNLSGKPFPGNDTIKPDRIFTIPDAFFDIYADDGVISPHQPIHLMPVKYQELFMNSIYYKEMLEAFPDVEYLKYIGSNSIPVIVSRRCGDGEIMRINTNKLSGYHSKFGNVSVSPDMVHLFTNVYKQTRDYVYNTLRGDFAGIYTNYNDFIRFLTIYMAMGQTLNELMKKSSSMSYLNNASANNYFMLYGLPSVIMEGQSMIDFLKQLRLLLLDKGTNVVYRVKDLVGYKYTDIYTLVMVKQQIFENGMPKYTYDAAGNASPMYKIVFRRMGTTADNTSYFKFRESNVEYDWKEIASGDPRWWWWNDPEVDAMLYEMNYTLSNSKYIQLSTHMSMTDIFWQSVILLRGLLDCRRETQLTPLSVNYDIGDNSTMNVFDAVLTLVILMNWNMNTVTGPLSGSLYKYNGMYDGRAACLDLIFNGLNDDGSPKELILGKPFKVASFNFDIQQSEFFNELPSLEYLNPIELIDMINKAVTNVTKNTGELMMTDVRKIYDYLVQKLLDARTIHEFRQVTDAYNNLFLVDPVRDKWYDTKDTSVVTLLSKKYNISEFDINSLITFCYNNPDNPLFKVTYNDTEYTVDLGLVLNKSVKTYKFNEEVLFEDPDFVNAFNIEMDRYTSKSIKDSNLPNSIKNNYRGLIKDKVTFDLNISNNGPETFESMLLIQNPSLYTKLMQMRNEGSSLIFLMRAIVKALEAYTISDLSALEFSVIGEKEYINILKEIISYFKSYMVEFTKDEFVYIMDGLFDNGGNSNMLKLYDEIKNLQLNMEVSDSLTLFDVTNSTIEQQFKDDNVGLIHDEAIIRANTTYGYIKQFGYDIWFDDGNKITKNEPDDITDESEVVATLSYVNGTYNVIIPIKNINRVEIVL